MSVETSCKILMTSRQRQRAGKQSCKGVKSSNLDCAGLMCQPGCNAVVAMVVSPLPSGTSNIRVTCMIVRARLNMKWSVNRMPSLTAG